jgi:hypothetical protein
MNQFSEWTPEENEELLRLISLNSDRSNQEYANRLTEKFKRTFTSESVRSKRRRLEKKKGSAPTGKSNVEEEYKETFEINQDGTQSSNKLLRMSIEDFKDVNFLMKAHSYDINAWELISAKNNIWNVYSKKDGINTLYSSKIVARPRTVSSLQDLINAINEIKPITIELVTIAAAEKRLLEIPLFDAHFGISDYTYYKPTQAKINDKLTSRYWEEILFIIGQDMLHNDDFRGRIANGTPIETVDMVKAWNDCRAFYEVLIETSIKQSNSV